MAQCDECGCFDDNEAENIDYPEILGDDDEKQQEWLEDQEDYQPDRYYYWHGDIQEDYQMPAGYECLCEECFGDFLNQGKIIELACNCRNHSRKRGVEASMSQPFDCHGYTLRALIMWRGGFIKPIDFYSADVDFRNAEEYPIETNPIATTRK